MKKILLLAPIILIGFSAWATHIIGGEMSYQYAGNNIYSVTLKVYRDCMNGQAPFDNPAYIFVFDSNGNLVETLYPSLLQDDTIPVTLSCAGMPSDMCAEQGTYEFDVTLPPIAGGYTLVYQRCCRSGIIGNLAAPLDEGMTITATIPDMNLATGNSSPVFANYPPTAFCVNVPINFDHSAIDADGDSLVYELCSGVAGADAMTPQPNPALPPPYPEVTYLPPYSGSYPFDTDPALAIDPATGLITGTPASIGVFTLGVMVKEYRNGLLIGEHRREMAEVYTVQGMIVPTGIPEDPTASQATVFPVPASNELDIIPASSDKIKEVKVFDMLGRLVFSEEINQSVEPFSISLDHFNDGEYYLQLVKESSIQTQSFIVTK